MARWTFKDAIGNWSRDRRGNFAILTGATISMLAMGVGFGVNTAQMMNTRSALLSALDAAVTSTARDLTTGLIEEEDAEEMVTAFLLANVGDGFATRERVTLENLEVDRTANTVSAGAVAVIDLAFPLFSTGETQEVRVESAAVYSDRKIEVAMMLDVTGSMEKKGRNDKIGDLKKAATNAVKLLLDSNRPGNERVRVALVPYANGVNAGPLAHTVYTERSARSPVEPGRLEDPRPVSGDGSQPASSCAGEREGRYQFSNVGPKTAMINRDYRLNYCPSAALMPLTTDADVLTNRIGSFRAQGHTAGQIGIQWTWYLLSREWADVLPQGSRPAANDPEEVGKFAILMTDGEFNTAYAGVRDGADVLNQPGKSRRYAERLCREMKAQGIEIFTIGFQLRENEARAVMRECASPDGGAVQHYFEASTGAELEQAYATIVGNIENLALTK